MYSITLDNPAGGVKPASQFEAKLSYANYRALYFPFDTVLILLTLPNIFLTSPLLRIISSPSKERGFSKIASIVINA